MERLDSDAFFEQLIENMDAVLDALAQEKSTCGYPVYASMDIRDSGWKVSAVDVNLFPAGFNILEADDRQRASVRMRQFFQNKLGKEAPWKVAVVPEAHTNNQGYLENLAGIIGIIEQSGAEVGLAWSGPPIPKAWKVHTRSGALLNYLPAEQALEDAEAVILNHDLSGGIPKFLEGCQLPIFPNPSLGWYKRRKSEHLKIVDALLSRLEEKFDFFDSWHFRAKSKTLNQINIENSENREQLRSAAAEMLEELAAEYDKRGIQERPALFVKNNQGTYGIGVLQIDSADELLSLNRKDQNKMRMGKESVPISDFILQEAIPTALFYDAVEGDSSTRIAGEPTLYLIDGLPIGGFIRLHEKLGSRAQWKNLNQPGGALESLGVASDPCTGRPFPKIREICPRGELDGKYIYHFLAKLHATAAGLEECP